MKSITLSIIHSINQIHYSSTKKSILLDHILILCQLCVYWWGISGQFQLCVQFVCCDVKHVSFLGTKIKLQPSI